MSIDWTLIKRSINTSLSAREQQQLEEWLRESPLHRELYREAGLFLENPEKFRPEQEKLLQFKIAYEKRLNRQHKIRMRRLLFRRMRMAAAVLLPLGLAFFFLYKPQGSEEDRRGYRVEIRPGEPKAVLVTGSGKQISLNTEVPEVEVVEGVKIGVEESTLIYPDTLSSGEKVENRLIIPRGGEYTLCLSDGSKIWMNSASELRYPVCFAGKERKVYLKGEAYFQVSPDSLRAFIVATDDLEVKVYGTEFNINTRMEESVQATLVKGAVSVCRPGGSEMMLKPDQMAEYNRKTGELLVREVDVVNYVSWKSGMYVFENRSVEEIMDELSLWYDIGVFYKNEACKHERFSGILPRYREIGDMLSMMEKTTHVRFEVKGKGVIVE